MPFEIDRQKYGSMYGPTAGDRVRFGDTDLFALIERDYTDYGNEILGGWGKNLRTGMMYSHRPARDSELDNVISNAIVVDPVMGIFKGSIGIKDGTIVGVGRAGNPDIMDDVDLVIGPNTVVYRGDGLIATPGGVDSHVHLGNNPKLMDVALSAGLTTLVGAGLNTTGRSTIQGWLRSFEHIPVNLALQARGNASHPSPMVESIEAGAAGFKIHEDEGAYPYVIDACLRVADEYDVSVALHTDGLHESMQVSDTIEAIGGRAVHAYHVEGAGGGHAPDLIRLAGVNNIITSSTTPTIPYTVSTYEEHFYMTAQVHSVNVAAPPEVAALDERLRRETMAAEDVLHDMGAVPIINSDSQGMGRIGEVITRTWQLAHKMKGERGATHPEHDNERILRYLAKYTLNPAITHGLSSHVGSLEPGKMADVVLWSPGFFGVKPDMVIKGGLVTWSPSGEGNASIRQCEPVTYGPAFGALGNSAASCSAFFVSQASLESDLQKRLGTRRKLLPVKDVRTVTKRSMVRNSFNPRIEVNLESKRISVDGSVVTSSPMSEVPLNRLYTLA